MMATEVIITPENCGWSTTAGAQSGVVEGVTVATGQGVVGTADDVAAMRTYKSQTLTISADANISKIVITCTANGTAKYGPGNFTGAGYTYEEEGKVGTWEGSANSVELVASGAQVRATEIVVTLDGDVPQVDKYYVVGSMTGWGVTEAYKLVANPENEGEFMGEFTFAVNDEFKVVKNQAEVWYPDGMDNNFKINEAGDYAVYFRPEGGVADWYYGFFNVIKKETPVIPDPTNCAEAREAALSVADDGKEEFNGGQVYDIKGYVTGIKTAYSDQYHNISFWMADEVDGGEVIQAFRAACASEADAPKVGDKVKVSGKLVNYHGTPEFAAGCTFEILVHQGIEETVAEGQTVKVVREGKLVILKGDHEYTPMGQIVK
jgi:hypothetical protein